MWKFTCAGLVAIFGYSSVAADGLVMALPEDKTGAVYEMVYTLEQGGKKVVQQGTVKISSVGRLEIAEVKLRWLEIVINTAEENDKYRMIYKVLIPEKILQEGGSPAESILKCWWTRKIRPKEEGKPLKVDLLDKHPHDERWTYLPTFILSGPLTAKKRLDVVAMNTPFGKAACSGVSGKFDYEQETRKWQNKVETRLHPKAPFGVVSSRVEFQMERNGKTFTGIAAFKLIEVLQNQEGELVKHQ